MMLWRNFFIAGILLLASAGSSATEDSNRVSVFVSYAGKDMVGQHVVSLLQEMIEASPDYKIAPSHEATMKITLASLNLDPGNRSAISTVITMRNYLSYDPAEPQTWYPIFLNSSLVVISSGMADEFASETMTRIGAALEHYREDVRKYQ